MASLEPLAASFIKNGFTYEQVVRKGRYAIYKQRLRPGVGCLAYEVITIKVAKPMVAFGKAYPEREVSPANEDFGFTCWTYPTLDQAQVRFNELVRGKVVPQEEGAK